MNNEINPDHIIEPELQVYVDADIDTLADRGVPAGTLHKTEERKALLLECAKKIAITLIAWPEEGAVHLWAYYRYTDRSFAKCFFEVRIIDAEDNDAWKEKIQVVRGLKKEPEKDLNIARDLYQAYLQAEDAVKRLVPSEVEQTLDRDSGVFFTAGLDSYTVVRGDERPKLHCYERKGIFTNEVDAKPYFLHTCEIPEGTKRLQAGFGGSVLDKFNGSRAEKVILPASLTELEASNLALPFVNCYEVKEGNPRFYSEDGVLYERDGKKLTLFKFPEALTGVFQVPDSVTVIGDRAFTGSKLRKLLVPESVQHIYVHADLEYEVAPENTRYFSADGVLCEHREKGDAVLRCPTEKTGRVVLPEGIAIMESQAFFNIGVTELSLPESLKMICDKALANCGIRELWLPKNVDEIGEETFIRRWNWSGDKPYGLQQIRVDPENERFYDVDGVLFERDGKERILRCYPPAREKAGEYEVPVGTTMIGKNAFFDNNTPKRILMPKDCAVSNEAKTGNWGSNLLGYAIFPDNCVETRVKLPAYCAKYVTYPRAAAFALLLQSGKDWESAAKTVMKKDAGAADLCLAEMTLLLKESFSEAAAKKAVQFALENSKIIKPETFRTFYAMLHQKQPKCLRTLLEDLQAQQILLGEREKPVSLHPAEQLMRDNWTISPLTKELKLLIPKGLPYRDGEQTSSPEAVIYVIDAYARQFTLPKFVSLYESDYCAATIVAAADQVAAAFRPEPFRELLEKLAFDERNEKLGLLLPFGRYADSDQIRRLIARMKDWGKWWSNASTGRRLVIQARGGLMLSDTKPAMAEIDRCGGLAHYAALRGTDADTLRDTVLSDFGFDADGKKRFDLGGNILAVSVEKDLSLSLYDENAKKTVKSVPKKGADPEKWEEVKNELSELRKSIRLVLTNRRRKLFAQFLSGEGQDAETWEKLYLGNPVLGSLARITVWQQGDRSFLLGDSGTIDAQGRPYVLGKEPVKVAHPIELKAGEVGLWQEYFLSRKLKQPFLQIWEPAYDPSDIREDRYMGCELSVYKFSGREKDGIGSYGLTDYSEDYGFTLTDCKLEAENSVWRFIHGVTDDATYKLGKFQIQKFSRVCNHIIFLLDKWTVEERIIKDDADLKSLLSAFTAAQISDLLALAQEKNSVKALSQLLNEKNERFGTVDLDAEFTLD